MIFSLYKPWPHFLFVSLKVTLVRTWSTYAQSLAKNYGTFSMVWISWWKMQIFVTVSKFHMYTGRNSCRSTYMTSQILIFVPPKFSVIIEMTGHFFSSTTRKEIVRDALKAWDIKWTTFKRMPHFFTDDNHYFVVSSCTTSPIEWLFVTWYQILKNKYNGHTLNSEWPFVVFLQALE